MTADGPVNLPASNIAKPDHEQYSPVSPCFSRGQGRAPEDGVGPAPTSVIVAGVARADPLFHRRVAVRGGPLGILRRHEGGLAPGARPQNLGPARPG